MANSSNRPFDEGPDDLSIRDPFAEFLSESSVAFEPTRPVSDELEFYEFETLPPDALGPRRSRSFCWPLGAAAAVTTIMVGSLTGVMMQGNPLTRSEELVRPAVSEAVSSLPSAPGVPHGAAVVPVIEELPSPTNSREIDDKRTHTDSRAVALPLRKATIGATVIYARPSSRNDVQPLPVGTPADASHLLAPVPVSSPANGAIPPSLAPADVRVTATASDPDGDELTYRWSAPIGRIANAIQRETVYTCPDNATTVPLTVTVADGHGGIASDTLTIHCGAERR